MRTKEEIAQDQKKEEELVFIPGVMQHIRRPKQSEKYGSIRTARDAELVIEFEPGEETVALNKSQGDIVQKEEEEGKQSKKKLKGILKRKVKPEEEKKEACPD